MAVSLRQFAKYGFSPEESKKIRELMLRFERKFAWKGIFPSNTLNAISDVMGGFGVETIPEGRNSRSPEIAYVNIGDTYDWTVLYVNGRFRVGAWGDIVERGSYE